MDSFIDLAAKFLEAYPLSTLSITYSNVAKKAQGKAGKVRFKFYDSALTKCVKYSTTKLKEVSKILTYLGPRGVSSAATDGLEPKQTVGAASVMANHKVKEVEVEAPAPSEESKPKKKKKKGKK